MPTHIALLRGINVGGRNLLAMSDLRDLCTSIGFTDVCSLLQSGNLAFRCDQQKCADIEAVLERQIHKRFNVPVDCVVRTAKEWTAVVARNPFPKEAERDPSHLLVMFFKNPPPAPLVDALRLAIKGQEIIRADGRQLYLIYPLGIGTSKLTNTLIEKKLGMRGTARNWNTVTKLAALKMA